MPLVRCGRPGFLQRERRRNVRTNRIGLLMMALLAVAAQANAAAPRVLFRDDFATLDTRAWIVEAEPARGGTPTPPVYTHGHRLVLDSAGGLTVWLNRRLAGHYEIDYTRTVVDRGGPHDRVSDLNQFWLANAASGDPAATPFGRSGKFSDYDSLDLFYAGVGGNGNTTTRFRHYDGSASRPLLAEYTSRPWLLEGNRSYRIRIVVDGGGTRFYLDGRPCFAAAGLLRTDGYFGFRSTASRQTISDFSIRALP
ncbi:hypothetical protein C7405_101340 [Paraburkholderia caballeronis]|nr:hypothetical protein C7405_101340 [Paraburkholderia caballeronis]